MTFANLKLSAIFACLLTTWAASTAAAQQGGIVGRGGLLQLLRSRRLAEELELSDQQRQQIQKLDARHRAAWREYFSGFGELSAEGRRRRLAGMREKLAQQHKEAEKEVAKILLPHQRQGLERILFRREVRQFGAVEALLRPRVIAALNITDQQRKELEPLQKEVAAELQQRIDQLRREAQEKLFSALTAQQQTRWGELMRRPAARPLTDRE